MGMLLAPVGIVGCDARAPASVNSGHMEDAMQNGTSTTTAQRGAEADQLAVGERAAKVYGLFEQLRKELSCVDPFADLKPIAKLRDEMVLQVVSDEAVWF